MGPRQRLYRGFMRQLGRLHAHFYRVYVRPFAPGPFVPPPGVAVRFVDEAALLPHLGDRSLDLPPDRAMASFARGERCAAAFLEGRLAGYAWFAYRSAPHAHGIRVTFPPQGMYVYRVLVHSSSRGAGVGEALFRFGDEVFLQERRRFALFCIETHNYASIAAARRAGASAAGGFAYLQLGRRLHALYSEPVVQLGLRFESGSA